MIEISIDLKFKKEPWKKALAISFFFYLILLIVFISIIASVRGDFTYYLIGMFSSLYLSALILGFRYMHRVFTGKFKDYFIQE